MTDPINPETCNAGDSPLDQRAAAQERRTREARWLEENREGIEASNAWVAEHGLPLARYRRARPGAA